MNIDQHILRALGQEPDAGPPADFARSVAARAIHAPAPMEVSVERWLLRALVAVFALSALAVAAMYGREWLAGFAAPSLAAASGAGPSALNWGAALLACVGMSWSLEQLRPRRQ